jgi:16S rRNA (guanine527-N7)-methyltransferase
MFGAGAKGARRPERSKAMVPRLKSDPPAPGHQLDRKRALALVHVSRETEERLDRFVALLLQWQAKTNLISPTTMPTIWTRHIADSLQLLPIAPHARTWVDVGPGAGFPGLVIAIALAGTEGSEVHLVEGNAKKSAFLREAARLLDIPAIVHTARIEKFAHAFGRPVDVVSARALAPLCRLLGLVHPLLKTGAQGLFPKGQDVDAELTLASKYWNMQTQLIPSKTNARSYIVVVRGLTKRADAGAFSNVRSI